MIDVFRVGVHIGMTSNGPQVIGILLRELGLLHGSVDSIISKMGKLKYAIGGAVAAIAGVKALEGLWHIVEAAKELNKELNRTKQLGGEFAATVGQARLAAFRTAGLVPTTTPSDNVKVQRELGAQLQNTQAAADILPQAQRTAFVISNFTGEKTDDIVKNLVKVAELRAQIFSRDANGKEVVDQAKVKTEFDAAMRALLLTGGFLKSNDLVQLAKQAGVPAKGMTAEAFYADAAEMSVSQGASRTGTALTSMYQQLIGGTMQKRVAEEMERMGLFNRGDYTVGKGSAITVRPEARARLAGQIGPDPIAYITGPLNDLMTAKGMDAKAKLDEVFQLFGRQTTQRLVAEALSSGPLFERARHMFGTIPDADTQYKDLQKNDLDTNLKSFQAAWTGFMQAIGEAGIPVAITVLQNLTNALHAMTAWAVANPDTARHLFLVAGGLSALAAVGGSLIVTAFALRLLGGSLSLLLNLTGIPLLARGLSSLATGVGALTAVSGIATVGAALAGLAGGISLIIGAIGLGGTKDPIKAQGQIETLEKQRRSGAILTPQDDGDAEGRPLVPPGSSPLIPPTSAPAAAQQFRGDVYLNRDKVGTILGNSLARSASGPSGGTTGFDIRAGTAGGMMALP